MSRVPKYRAFKTVLKMVIEVSYVLQKTFTKFFKPQFKTGSTKKLKKDTKLEKLHHFGHITSK